MPKTDESSTVPVHAEKYHLAIRRIDINTSTNEAVRTKTVSDYSKRFSNLLKILLQAKGIKMFKN